jgi:AraC-like DNA-binding protein
MHALHDAKQSTGPTRLRDLSVQDFGFYDQSHFIKEFKFFTGATPTAFLRGSQEISTQVLRFCLNIDVRELQTSARRVAYEM